MTEPLAPETRVADRYTITDPLQARPHDQWYRARTDWGQTLLINVFYAPHTGTPTGNRIRQAFMRNARLLAQAQQPQVCRVTDIIEEPERQLVVIEDRWQSTLRETRLTDAAAPRLLDVTRQVLSGLAAAHGQALLHTRLCPEAIWFADSGGPVLGQFDLGAQALFDEREEVVHDPRYSAPELLAGSRFTPQTDLYAFGATMLEALTGGTMPSAAARKQGVPLPVPRTALPPGLLAALHECLELEPARRSVSASEALAQLQRASAVPIPQAAPAVAVPAGTVSRQPTAPVTVPVPTPPPTRSPASRRSAGLLGGAALGLLIAGGVVLMLGRPATSPALTPEPETRTAAEAAPVPEPAESGAEQVIAPPPAPLVLSSPLPNTTQASGSFPLRGTGAAGEILEILEDGTSLGQTQVGADGSWTYDVPNPAAGAHMYSVTGRGESLLARLPLTVAAPPEPPAPVPVETIGDEETREIVDAYMASGAGDNVAPAMSLYADQVDYFSQGVRPKSALYDDKRAYFVRWPRREYERTTDITTLSETGNIREVRFDYRYDIERPDKELWGTAYTVLKLTKSGGQVLITGERGAIYPETQQKRVLAVPVDEPAAETTVDQPSGAPTFRRWYFTTCQDAATGLQQTGLSLGRLQRCQLVIETTPNGAQPVSALFTYELEYEEGGETQKFVIDAPDQWPSPSEPATTYEGRGDTLIFTLPLAVKDRAERRYTQINATGEIRFDNGSSKKVYEKLPINER